MPAEIISFLAASILLTISPGPDIIYVLVQSMATSVKDGIAVSVGLVSGIWIHTSLVAFGVSAMILTSPFLFMAIKLAGALYLLFIAYQVWKSDSSLSLNAKTQTGGFRAMFTRGLLMNVFNPKVTVFFVAFFPTFIWNPKEDLIFQFYTLGILFMLQAFLIFCGVAILARQIASFLNKSKSSQVFFKYLQIAVLIGIAVLIFVE